MRIGEKRGRCWHIEAPSPCAFISQFASIRVHSRFNLPHGVALRWRGRWVLRAGHGLLIRGAAWKATLHIGLRAPHGHLRGGRAPSSPRLRRAGCPRSQVSLLSFAKRLVSFASASSNNSHNSSNSRFFHLSSPLSQSVFRRQPSFTAGVFREASPPLQAAALGRSSLGGTKPCDAVAGGGEKPDHPVIGG